MSQSVMAHLYVQTTPSYSYRYNHFHLFFCPHASSTYWWLQSIIFMAWNSVSELYAKWHWQDYLLKCNSLKSEVPWNLRCQEENKAASCIHLQGTHSLMLSWLSPLKCCKYVNEASSKFLTPIKPQKEWTQQAVYRHIATKGIQSLDWI